MINKRYVIVHTPETDVKVQISQRSSKADRWRHTIHDNAPHLYYQFRTDPHPDYGKLSELEQRHVFATDHWRYEDYRIQHNIQDIEGYSETWWDLPYNERDNISNREIYEQELCRELMLAQERVRRNFEIKFCKEFEFKFQDALYKFVKRGKSNKKT